MKRDLLLVVLWCLATCVTGICQVRQLAELTASDGTGFDEFGFSVAVSGNTVVVGQPDPFVSKESVVHVFVRSGNQWNQVAELRDGLAGDLFGFSVAISADGGTIVAGAPNSSTFGTGYIFVRPVGGWKDMMPTAVLSPAGGQQDFGHSVGVSNDGTTVVAGAPGSGDPGAAFVFVKPAGGWQSTSVPTATLLAAGSISLGHALAMSGNTVVVAGFGFGVTSVYVFVKPLGGWQDAQPTATLSASDLNGIDQFGASVAINGNTVVVGSPFHFDGGSGAAYVFVAPPGGWRDMTQTAELTVPVRNTIELGMSVAVVGNLIAVGAPLDVIGQTKKGAVFGYLKPSGGWKNTNMPNLAVTSSDGAAKDTFGSSIALSSTIGVIGAPQHAVNGQTFQGAAYVFGQR